MQFLVKKLVDEKMARSYSEARRLISTGQIKVDGKQVLDIDKLVESSNTVKVDNRDLH